MYLQQRQVPGQTGVDWVVPATQGTFPVFPANTTDIKKKTIIAKFLCDKHNLGIVKGVKDLLKNQLIEAIGKDCFLEFKEGILEYSEVTFGDVRPSLQRVRPNG